jgi:hypothetical protein
VFRREFASGFANYDGPSADSSLDQSDLAEFLAVRPEIQAVSSHHLRYPKPAIRNLVIFDCCFLRHPLDRLLSLYAWARRNDSPDPVCHAARVSSPREFTRRLLDEFPHMVSNVQVTLLANAGAFTRPANQHDLEVASGIVREMAVPGLVELFDESLIAAEYFLRPAFPNLRLHCQPQNVSRPDEQHRPDRERELEQKLVALWGAGTYADLVRLNEFDLELYNRMRQEIERRFFLVPGVQEKMADFEARCAPTHATAAGGALGSPQPVQAGSGRKLQQHVGNVLAFRDHKTVRNLRRDVNDIAG